MSSSASSRLHALFSKSPKHISATTTSTSTTAASNRLHSIFSKSAKRISATTTTTTAAASPATFPPSSTSTSKQTSNTSPTSLPPQIKSLITQFKKDSKSPDFRNQKHLYESIVRRLASGHHYSAISNILEYQTKFKDDMLNEGFAVRLITLYGKAAMFDKAYNLFNQLPHFNCTRTVLSFTALLSACVNSKKFDKVNQLFRDIPEEIGIEPDVFSYNMVIKGFCESKDFDSVMKVVEKMEGGPIPPDTVTFNTILEAYYKENNVDEAEKLWRRMEETGVIADVWTYNAKLRNLIRNDQVVEAFELVEKMVIGEVKPDNFTYNTLIKWCVGKGKLEEAKMLHGKMAGEGCLPDHTTYEMLISFACGKGDIDFALELCKQAIELKVPVYKSSMQLVVDALIKKSGIAEANELVALVNSSKRHRYTLLPVSE